MLWIYFGLVVIAITMAMLTTALTTVTMTSAITIYGTKVSSKAAIFCYQSSKFQVLFFYYCFPIFSNFLFFVGDHFSRIAVWHRTFYPAYLYRPSCRWFKPRPSKTVPTLNDSVRLQSRLDSLFTLDFMV